MAATCRDVLRSERVTLEAVLKDELGGPGKEYGRRFMKWGGVLEMAGCQGTRTREGGRMSGTPQDLVILGQTSKEGDTA